MDLLSSLKTFLADPTLSLLPLLRAWRRAKSRNRRLHAVIMAGGLGDIVAAEPTIRAIKHDDEELIVLVRPNFMSIFDYHPSVDGVLRLDAYAQGLVLKALLPRLRWTNLQVDGNRCNFTGIKFRNRNAHGITASNFYADQRSLADVYALVATGTTLDKRPRVYPAPEFHAQDYLRRLFPDQTRSLLVVHVQSTEVVRSFSSARAAEEVAKLQQCARVNILEMGFRPVLAESDSVKHLGGQLTIPQQIAVMARGTLFLGVDSGFSHIANALKLPSVLMLGPYMNFDNYLPWLLNDDDALIRSDHSVDQISPSATVQLLLRRASDKARPSLQPLISSPGET